MSPSRRTRPNLTALAARESDPAGRTRAAEKRPRLGPRMACRARSAAVGVALTQRSVPSALRGDQLRRVRSAGVGRVGPGRVLARRVGVVPPHTAFPSRGEPASRRTSPASPARPPRPRRPGAGFPRRCGRGRRRTSRSSRPRCRRGRPRAAAPRRGPVDRAPRHRRGRPRPGPGRTRARSPQRGSPARPPVTTDRSRPCRWRRAAVMDRLSTTVRATVSPRSRSRSRRAQPRPGSTRQPASAAIIRTAGASSARARATTMAATVDQSGHADRRSDWSRHVSAPPGRPHVSAPPGRRARTPRRRRCRRRP